MNKEELQEAQDKLENLGKNERWKPNKDTLYWFLNSAGKIDCNYFSLDIDEQRYNAYNCFQTQEEAQREANKILIRRKLEGIARRLNGDEKIDWHDINQNKYCIYYDCCSDDLELDNTWTCPSPGVVYCLSKDFLQTAIKEIGARELADYITGQ